MIKHNNIVKKWENMQKIQVKYLIQLDMENVVKELKDNFIRKDT